MSDASHKSVPENPPAFPTEWSWGLVPGEPMQTGDHTAQYPGMTLRDWFAGQAFTAAAEANYWRGKSLVDGSMTSAEAIAERAYQIADAMLAAREASK